MASPGNFPYNVADSPHKARRRTLRSFQRERPQESGSDSDAVAANTGASVSPTIQAHSPIRVVKYKLTFCSDHS